MKAGRASLRTSVSPISQPASSSVASTSAPVGLLPCSPQEQGGVSLRHASLRALHCGHTRKAPTSSDGRSRPRFRQSQVSWDPWELRSLTARCRRCHRAARRRGLRERSCARWQPQNRKPAKRFVPTNQFTPARLLSPHLDVQTVIVHFPGCSSTAGAATSWPQSVRVVASNRLTTCLRDDRGH
jgi:hypothetical protein